MDKISSLKKLKGLLEQGIITEEEFNHQKKLILDGEHKDESTASQPTQSTKDIPITESSEQHTSEPVKRDSLVNTAPNSYEKGTGEQEQRKKESPTGLYLGVFLGSLIVAGGILFFVMKEGRNTENGSVNNQTTLEAKAVKPEIPKNPDINYINAHTEGMQAVDMGLMVHWGAWYLDAESIDRPGKRYAWGETISKESFSQYNYKFKGDRPNESSKYNKVDRKDILDPGDDAATMNLGSWWRMPEYYDVIELHRFCKIQEKWINGKPFVEMKSWFTGNSIYFPIENGQSFPYWISHTYGLTDWAYAQQYELKNNKKIQNHEVITDKYNGYFIRPVAINYNYQYESVPLEIEVKNRERIEEFYRHIMRLDKTDWDPMTYLSESLAKRLRTVDSNGRNIYDFEVLMHKGKKNPYTDDVPINVFGQIHNWYGVTHKCHGNSATTYIKVLNGKIVDYVPDTLDESLKR